MKNRNIIIVLPAKNFNEKEFVVTKTVLERGNTNLFIASDAVGLCVGENKLKVKADMKLCNIHAANFAAIVFIGGSGVKDYIKDKHLCSIINQFNEKGKIVAAICAASLILANAGILSGKKATCYPKYKSELLKMGIEYIDDPIVISNNIITAKDYNAVEEFAFAIIQQL